MNRPNDELKEAFQELLLAKPEKWIALESLADKLGVSVKKVENVLETLDKLRVPIERSNKGVRVATKSSPLLSLPPGEWFTVKRFSQKLGVSEWKTQRLIKEAKERGLPVETKRGKGFRLVLQANDDGVQAPATKKADASPRKKTTERRPARKRRWAGTTGYLVGAVLSFLVVGAIAVTSGLLLQKIGDDAPPSTMSASRASASATMVAGGKPTSPVANETPRKETDRSVATTSGRPDTMENISNAEPRTDDSEVRTLTRIARNLETVLGEMRKQIRSTNQRLSRLEAEMDKTKQQPMEKKR